MDKRTREMVYNKCNGHCAYCGIEIEYKEMHVDHIVPLRRGDTNDQLKKFGIERGKDEFENYNPSCRRCNLMKSSYPLEVFRENVKGQVEQCNFYSSNYRHAKRFGLVKEIDKNVVFYFEK